MSQMISLVAATRLEKAAADNGFDLELPGAGEWLAFASSQTPLHIWLTALNAPEPGGYLVALPRRDVLHALSDHGTDYTTSLPGTAVGVRRVDDIPGLDRLLRRAFQLARTLPDELLDDVAKATARMPRATEAEHLSIQRVGQDIFRRGLLEYWDGRCALTGLAVPELLRASHIKPWADCPSDAERLDVFNGFLLAPQFDAVFDGGFITIAADGSVVVSDTLPHDARALLGLDQPLRIRDLRPEHERYLTWHRARVFKKAYGLPPP